MTSLTEPSPNKGQLGGIVRWSIVSLVFMLLICLSLFLSAGTISWPSGWAYLVLAIVIQLLDAIVLIPRNPDLLVERSRPQAGVEKWDQLLSRLMATIGPLVIWVTCGLDYRFGWTATLPLWLVLASSICVFAGGMLALWAMAANRYFIGMVRILEERDHKVIVEGPYRFIRHPGYLGSLLFIFFTPWMLGSMWGLVPAILTCGVVILRTYLEDRFLVSQLPGYRDYTNQVAFRLFPRIW